MHAHKCVHFHEDVTVKLWPCVSLPPPPPPLSPPSLPLPAILLSFYFSHWEKYITGTLYLPWFYDFSQTVSGALGGRGWWAGTNGWG